MTKDRSKATPIIGNGVRHRMVQFAASEVFTKLFSDGMGLVEETASYLDGDGREASRKLTREASLSYATVSMEMTTRLMQAASWLVVQRAVKEGDMTVEEAAEARFRLEDTSINAFTARQNPELPMELISLVDRAKDLFDRLHRLDDMIFEEPTPAPNAVTSQLQALQDAASSGAFNSFSGWQK
jgi:regulator of CtrA degradation